MKDLLLGGWELISCKRRMQDGEEDEPMGPNPQGLLIYLSHGKMSVQIMRRNRKPFESNDMWGGIGQEFRDAFVSYTAYYGRYEVGEDGTSIVHYVEGSLFPNWEGATQYRKVAFVDGTLVLTSAPILAGEKSGVVELCWKRSG